MLIYEYRVTMPISFKEYQVGQLFSVAEASLNETGGGEGVEVIHNYPYDNFPLFHNQYTSGQYTKKIYHLESKVPRLVRMVAPKGSMEVHEEAWNAYPYCRTVLTNPGYMKDKFMLTVETLHVADDRGQLENAHRLSTEQLAVRKVIHIDIAHDPVVHHDYKTHEDPKLFRSKDGRGPLTDPDWRQKVEPVMTAYKLVTVEFKWFGLQTKVERFAADAQRRLYTNLHRQLFCSIDKWVHLDMNDIRKLEAETQAKLEEQRRRGSVRGTRPE